MWSPDSKSRKREFGTVLLRSDQRLQQMSLTEVRAQPEGNESIIENVEAETTMQIEETTDNINASQSVSLVE